MSKSRFLLARAEPSENLTSQARAEPAREPLLRAELTSPAEFSSLELMFYFLI